MRACLGGIDAGRARRSYNSKRPLVFRVRVCSCVRFVGLYVLITCQPPSSLHPCVVPFFSEVRQKGTEVAKRIGMGGVSIAVVLVAAFYLFGRRPRGGGGGEGGSGDGTNGQVGEDCAGPWTVTRRFSMSAEEGRVAPPCFPRLQVEVLGIRGPSQRARHVFGKSIPPPPAERREVINATLIESHWLCVLDARQA